MERHRLMHRAGVGLLAVGIMFWPVLAIKQMVGGEADGWVLLLPGIVLAPFLYYAVRAPRGAGIALMATSVALAAFSSVLDPLGWEGAVVCLFPLVAGALLFPSAREGP